MQKKVIDPTIIDKAKVLKEQGFTRRQVAEALRISYHIVQDIFGPERLGIDRTNKQPWTIENLKKLQEVYKEIPIRDVCLMFNRDRYEIRQLLFILKWEIPTGFFRGNKEDIKKEILKLHKKYNIREISRILNAPFSNIQAICQENGIVCSSKRGTLEKELQAKKKTPESMMKEAIRESADSIKEKLRKNFQQKGNK